MKIISSITELSIFSEPLVLVVGTFDGVHCGHQALIRCAQEEVKKCAGRVVVMTFDQHPASFLRPEKAPKLLTTTAQKIKLIEGLGVDAVLLLPFNAALAATTAEEFIHQLSTAAPILQAICMGEDWSFGCGGKGNLALLRELGKKFHFAVMTIDPVFVEGKIVSSTRIRMALAAGHLNEAAACLGRPYFLSAVVTHGSGRGKKIGFPTANLATEGMQLPHDGVYAVNIYLGENFYNGIANVGRRPTVSSDQASRVVEVHLFDFEDDLYDQEIKIELLSFVREEKKFPSVDDLKKQIARDVDEVRRLVASRNF